MKKNIYVNHIKRATALLLMATLFLCGCKQKENVITSKEPESLYEDHLDISIAYWLIDEAIGTSDDDKVLDYIQKRFNVTIEPVNLTWDDYTNKLLLLAQTNTLPDVFTGDFRKGTTFLDWVSDGILHELPEDLSKYPDLEEYMNSVEKDTCMLNGKTYCIFRQTYSEQAETTKDRTILYRWDLAQKAGITQEPTTWEEFRNMITKIREVDPEGTNIGGLTSKGYTMISGVLLPYSVPYGSTGGSRFYWVESNGRYVPAIFAGETFGGDALPAWKLIRDMYTEGTIEPDITMVSTSQAEESFLNSKTSAICIDGGISNTKLFENIGTFWKGIHGTEFWDDVKYLKLMPDKDGNLRYPVWDYAWSETYINANVSDAKLDRILAIYDYLLSEEGTLLSNFGIEGESYSVLDDGSIVLKNDISLFDKYPSIKAFSSFVCWNYGNHNAYKYPDVVPTIYVLKDAERVDEARHVQIAPYSSECMNLFFNSGYDFSIDINSIFKRMILGTGTVEEDWQKIIDEYIDMGIMDIIDEVNAKMAQ